MKATPKLIQLALGAIGIGAELEMCIKIHEVVKLLNEKGDLADLSDLAKIAAIQVESEKPQSEALLNDEINETIDLSTAQIGDMIVYRGGGVAIIKDIYEVAKESSWDYLVNTSGHTSPYLVDGCGRLNKEVCSSDIVKIIKPN